MGEALLSTIYPLFCMTNDDSFNKLSLTNGRSFNIARVICLLAENASRVAMFNIDCSRCTRDVKIVFFKTNDRFVTTG